MGSNIKIKPVVYTQDFYNKKDLESCFVAVRILFWTVFIFVFLGCWWMEDHCSFDSVTG